MTMSTIAARRRLGLSASIAGLALACAAPVQAQTSTGTIRGVVAGATAGTTTVTARNLATNQTVVRPVDAAGRYVLANLRPGSYEITIPGAGGQPIRQRVIVGVGEQATLNLDAAPAAPTAPAAPAAADGAPATVGGSVTAAPDDQAIIVTAGRLVETKTSEVATNVSAQQIQSLPQTDRNFLSFAQLAPGVRYNDSDTNKGFQSGASNAAQVNVFIDGVSLKNNVLSGGIVGQQDSRGNPFAQLAVQEFRVLTQNYKAEYEQAAAALVTAITKSGTNEFHGEAFAAYQDKSMTEKSVILKRQGLPEPAYKRKQYGVSLGGPIIKDKLFFFGAYEGNDQDRASTVILGNRTPANLARFGQYEGAYVSPFRQDIYFGKLTFTPDEAQTLDLSFNRRQETDITGFGDLFGNAQAAFSVAQNKKNRVDTYNGKWTYRGDTFVNETTLTYLDYVYNPTAINPDSPTTEYAQTITFGGADSTQRISQQSWTLRNDLTLNDLEFAGRHIVKFGVKYSVQSYDFEKLFFVQPRYTYRNDSINNLTFDFPAEAQLGIGDPRISASNSQFGIYAQDDWDVTDRLQLNLGIRWDYESNLFNNRYVTPDAARRTLLALPTTDYFNGADYITDGEDRPSYKKAFQPRIGFSYDLFDDQRTVFFGGYGKYFDRNVFNDTLDEQFRLQYATGVFRFSQDGLPRDGNPTVRWDPKYLTREGLAELRASAQTGLPELFAIKSRMKPLSTDQFSLGVRQKIGIFQTSLTASYIRGQDGFTYIFATRNPDGTCCNTDIPRANGFGNVLAAVDGLESRYKAIYATIEKPYTQASGWGVNLAYTFSRAKQNGGDLFSLDAPTPADYGFYPRSTDERHRIVLSGSVDLPWDMRLSTLSQAGTGLPFTIDDQSQGSGVNQRVLRRFAGRPDKNCLGTFAFCSVDLKLEKQFRLFESHILGVALDVFNVFNNKNYGGFNGFIPTLPEDNPDFGRPNSIITRPRSIQVGAYYRF
ncbi:MAG TPA: TonB-dependent receptor [Sphingomonas sp.]|uniref:TonB-dependent receptor n=1 Tax=Sphingomonas sp. TaxID=28214 RepID=UPI002ED9221C